MPRIGRNDPCPCGSGRKAKRCCGTPRGPSEAQLARAALAQHARRAAAMLAPLEPGEFDAIFEQLIDLPTRDASLQLRLPSLVSPEQARLYAAVESGDPESVARALPPVLAITDTPQARARLAGAVADLERAGRLRRQLAAVALIDLEGDPSVLFAGSLMHAALVAVGRRPTPAGLVVAA